MNINSAEIIGYQTSMPFKIIFPSWLKAEVCAEIAKNCPRKSIHMQIVGVGDSSDTLERGCPINNQESQEFQHWFFNIEAYFNARVWA